MVDKKYGLIIEGDILSQTIKLHVMTHCTTEETAISARSLMDLIDYAAEDEREEYRSFDSACRRVRKGTEHFITVTSKTPGEKEQLHYYYDRSQKNPDLGLDQVRNKDEIPIAAHYAKRVRAKPAPFVPPAEALPVEEHQSTGQMPLVMGYRLNCGVFIPLDCVCEVLRELNELANAVDV